MLTLTQLKNRGWSPRLIEKFLGPPDETARNPVFRSKAPVKLWERNRVESGEKQPEFIAYQSKRARASARSKSVAERKRKEQLDEVDATNIYVKRWQLSKVYQLAIKDWRLMGIERGDYDRDGNDADTPTKNRWAVNYIMHNLCSFDRDLVLLRGQSGVGEAKVALEYKIYDAIAEAYPALAADSYQQADRLWGQAPAVGRWTPDVEAHWQQDDTSLTEKKRYILHRRIERDPSVTRRAKCAHGTRCRCCNFDFEAAYGALGAGYIEAHHLKPSAKLEEGQEIECDIVTDFTVLCANCHRMIHRMDDPSDLKGLQQLPRTGTAYQTADAQRSCR